MTSEERIAILEDANARHEEEIEVMKKAMYTLQTNVLEHHERLDTIAQKLEQNYRQSADLIGAFRSILGTNLAIHDSLENGKKEP